MKRIYCITMPDGVRYGIPAGYIAHLYAKFYEEKGEAYSDNYKTMIHWFDTNDYEFEDWAKNNLDWADVKDYAFVLPPEKIVTCNYEDGWVNGDTKLLHEIPPSAVHAYEQVEKYMAAANIQIEEGDAHDKN